MMIQKSPVKSQQSGIFLRLLRHRVASGFWLLASLILITLISNIQPAFAQTTDSSLRLITSPLPISLATPPGTSISADLRVQNAGSQSENLKVGLLKFSAYGDTGVPKIEERGTGDDYFDWVSFSEPTFSLAPNEWKTVTMTIAVPLDAAFGYYYAVTFSRAQEEIDQTQPQAALVGSTATLVLLEAQVPGAIRAVEVVDFSTPEPWYEFLPVPFTIRLKNTGNVHVAPRGNIFITQRGKDIGLVEVNPFKGNILPDSTREFEVQWSDGFPKFVEESSKGSVVLDDQGNAKQDLEWDFAKANTLRWGEYDANLVLAYDDGTKDVPIEAATEFWVIPWRIIVGLILTAVVFMVLGSILLLGIQKLRRRGNES